MPNPPKLPQVFFALLSLCFYQSNFGSQLHQQVLYQYYEPKTGVVELSAAMQELMQLTRLEFDGTAKDLLKVTEQNWLRPAGKERWQAEERANIEKEQFLKVFDKLQLLQPFISERQKYNQALVIGATCGAMKTRLVCLREMMLAGKEFETVYILVGERPLDPIVESE